ncbi:hypothetical protein [Ensifer canadensis]
MANGITGTFLRGRCSKKRQPVETQGAKPTAPEIAAGYKQLFCSIDIAAMTGRKTRDQGG